MKSLYVSGLCDGTRVDDIFLVCSKSQGYTQDGSPFLRMKLGDRTGTIDAIKWDANEALCNGIANDEFVRIRGIVTTYNGKLQIRMDSIRLYRDKIDPSDFLPRSEKDIDEMIAEILEVVDSIKHPQLRAVLDFFFKDQDFLSRFSTAPAAQKIHHAYVGGLIEHSLAVATMCDIVASRYSNIDRDLIVTGAILHDIGKIEEFYWDWAIRYSDCGHLVGHVVGGMEMIKDAIEHVEGFDPLLKLILMHIILSHHGQKEWGSPKRPKSLEAIILHHIDDLDAKINTFKQAVGSETPEDESSIWTERHWVFERPLFKGMPKPKTSSSNGDESLEDLILEPDFDPFTKD